MSSVWEHRRKATRSDSSARCTTHNAQRNRKDFTPSRPIQTVASIDTLSHQSWALPTPTPTPTPSSRLYKVRDLASCFRSHHVIHPTTISYYMYVQLSRRRERENNNNPFEPLSTPLPTGTSLTAPQPQSHNRPPHIRKHDAHSTPPGHFPI